MLHYLIIGLAFGTALAIWFVVRHHRRIWKITGIIGVALLCLLGGILSVGLLLATALCGHYDFPPVRSPDHRRIAIVTEDDCGAADHFHSDVEIKTSALNFGFRSGDTVFKIAEDPRVLEIEWIGPHELVIRYPDDPDYAEEFSCREQWKDVRITCISFPRGFVKPLQKMPPVKRGIW